MTCVPPCAPNTPESGNVRPPAPAGASVEITGPLEVNIAGAGTACADPLFVEVCNQGGESAADPLFVEVTNQPTAGAEIGDPLYVAVTNQQIFGDSCLNPAYVQVCQSAQPGLTVFPINQVTEGQQPEPILTDGKNYYRADQGGVMQVVEPLNFGPRVVLSTTILLPDAVLVSNTDHTVTIQNTGDETISYNITEAFTPMGWHRLAPGQSATYSGRAKLETQQPPGYTGLIITVFGTRPVVLL